MIPALVRRRLLPAVAAVVLLDWALPIGFLHRLFYSHRWFPTNITRLFAEALASPATPAAILVVSASAPLFWVMGGLLTAAVVKAARSRRTGGPSRKLLVLLTAQIAFFILAEFLLPWMNEKGFLRSGWTDVVFPAVTRGHGRVFGWLHALSAAAFVLQCRAEVRPPSS